MAVLGFLSLAVSSTSAANSHRTTPKCPPGHPRVIAADRQAEVYKAPFVRELPYIHRIFGCTFRTGRTYKLGEAPEPHYGGPGGASGVVNETLDGTVVAYTESVYSAFGGGSDVVIVRDLRGGRVLHEVPTGTQAPTGVPPMPQPPQIGIGPVAALVVKADGAVAWIVATGRANGTYQVHAIDETGSRVLASGADIDPSSLALAGCTLYWMQAGTPFFARLN
ncbi:MAG: hypothetical protein JWN10_2494 [Solirubrobacterales bacterium]|nr:hypothetical protein [Solirubrobacterales bacterium]